MLVSLTVLSVKLVLDMLLRLSNPDLQGPKEQLGTATAQHFWHPNCFSVTRLQTLPIAKPGWSLATCT